jgi:SAM-dependent methyltransferase
MDERQLQDEAKFADAHYEGFTGDLSINPVMFRKYSDPKYFWDLREKSAQLLGPVAGKRMLDYGCGMGEETIYFAKLGAHVTSIDISPVGIELTKRRAEFNGLADRVDASVRDATQTGFADESFDLVHGLGIIHHLGAENSFRELYRVMKPGARGVFLEHLGDSRAVEKLKRWVYREEGFDYTDHEKPLVWEETIQALRRFRRYELHPYYLSFRLRRLMPVFGKPFARKLDHAILTTAPFLRHFAGAVLIYVEK